MKKFYSFVVLLFWSLNTFSQAPIVHGTVVNQSSVAVAGQVIHLTDSSNGVQLYVATDTTNANGEYSFTIPGNVPTGSGMHLRTEKCGMVYSIHLPIKVPMQSPISLFVEQPTTIFQEL